MPFFFKKKQEFQLSLYNSTITTAIKSNSLIIKDETPFNNENMCYLIALRKRDALDNFLF
jgi:hypothetical protein